MPRVLLYLPGLKLGGAERVLALVATDLARRGYGVTIAEDVRSAAMDDLVAGLERVELGGNHFRSVAGLRRLLVSRKPDLLLAAVGGSNVKAWLAHLAAASRARLVIAYHGFDEHRNGGLGYLTYRLLPLLSRRADRIVAVSDALRAELIARWGADAARTRRIYNPVQLPAPSIPAIGADDLARRPPVVLAVGRLVWEKDLVTLVRAFHRLGRPDARLVIVGEGPERGRIEAEIASLGLSGAVTLTGALANPWPCYGAARCFAISSVTESFGNVVVEALASGLPVVATAAPGPKEILDGGTHGRIVPTGDIDALAAGLAAALDQPGDPAPRIARSAEFSLANGLAAYARLIEELIGRPESAVEVSR